MNQVYLQPVILSAFGATTTDVVVNDGYLTLGNATKYTPALYIPNGSAKIQKSLVEVPYIVAVTGTAANSTVYSFTITQFNRALSVYQPYIVSYTSDATATAGEIGLGLVAAVNAQNVAAGGALNVTASGTTITAGAGQLTLTGGTGDPLFTVSGLNTLIQTSQMFAGASPGVTIASNTTATPTVFTTSGNHLLAVGNVITITNGGAGTEFAAGTYRVRTVPLATTFTLETMAGVPLPGTATAIGTIVRVAQKAVGTYALVSAVANTNGTAIAGATYTQVTFNIYPKSNEILTSMNRQSTRQVVYMDEVTAAANFLTNLAGLINVLNGLDNAGTVANPELLAIGY